MIEDYTPRRAITWEEVRRNLRREIQHGTDSGESTAFLAGLEVAEHIHQSATERTKSPYRRKEIFLRELRTIQGAHERTLDTQPEMSDEMFEEYLAGITRAIVYGEAHRPEVDPYRLRDRGSTKLVPLAALALAGASYALSRKLL